MNNYNIYRTSRIISTVGDSLQELAIISIIASYTNSLKIVSTIVCLTAIVKFCCSILVLNYSKKINLKTRLFNLNIIYGITTTIFYILFITNNKISFWYIIAYELICVGIYTFYKIYKDVLIKEICDSNKKIAKLLISDNISTILTMIIGAILGTYINIKIFLLLNAISFFITAVFINLLKISTTEIIQNENKKNFISNIIQFKKDNKKVFIIIVVVALISFLFTTYSLVFQYSLKKYDINQKYVGYLVALYYTLTIFFSYFAGNIKTENILKFIKTFLKTNIFLFLFILLLKNSFFIVIIILIYSIYGGAINTLVQIYLQHNLEKNEIVKMKGIYNILCGSTIIFSSITSPHLIKNINLFIFIMIFINIISYYFLKNKK